jgi:phage repressor protein C with HTH and peptisase S24 domain
MIKAIKLKGSSMYPFFKDGEFIFFQTYDENKKINKGDAIIYKYEGKIFLHKIFHIYQDKLALSNDDDLPIHFIEKKDIIGLPIKSNIYRGKIGYFISKTLKFIRRCKHSLN